MVTLALDCDGVIFDTLKEDMLCIHNALCNMKTFKDRFNLGSVLEPKEFYDSYLQIADNLRGAVIYRPYVRLAEYYIAVLHLYDLGVLPEDPRILDDIEINTKIREYMQDAENRMVINKFRHLFYKARIQAKSQDYNGWKRLSILHNGIKKVVDLAYKNGINICIVTGRSVESTMELLTIHNLKISEIYGREHHVNKRKILTQLNKYNGNRTIFVDDSLENVINGLGVSEPYLATWGYITPKAPEIARNEGIGVLNRPEDIVKALYIK